MWVCWDRGRWLCTDRRCKGHASVENIKPRHPCYIVIERTTRRPVFLWWDSAPLSGSGTGSVWLPVAGTGDRLLAPLISEDSCSSDQRCFSPMLSNENNFNLSASTVGGNWTHMVHVLCTVIWLYYTWISTHMTCSLAAAINPLEHVM